MSKTGIGRDPSLDSFRGLDVLLMILVNVQGNGEIAFATLKHAEWNGLTFADLVFPIFLLIVGLSAPLALDKPGHTFSNFPESFFIVYDRRRFELADQADIRS
jgi:predicted acyltransferase